MKENLLGRDDKLNIMRSKSRLKQVKDRKKYVNDNSTKSEGEKRGYESKSPRSKLCTTN